MSITMNLAIILTFIILSIMFFWLKLRDKTDLPDKKANEDTQLFKVDQILHYVKESINDIGKTNIYDLGLSEDDYLRRKRKLSELEYALKNCNTGDINNKLYVKEYIFDLLSKTYNFDNQTINYPIAFNDPSRLSSQDMFDILLHLYKNQYSFDALIHLFENYNLASMKSTIEDGTESYIITPDEIKEVFRKEKRLVDGLTFEDKLQIITQRIYSKYRGFGVIDEIRDMKIDGVSGGVSGLPIEIKDYDDEKDLFDSLKGMPSNLRSIWVMYRGKTIHLSFLTFGTKSEHKRVCQNIYKHNNPGQLSESKPYIVNEMADGSRVVVVRPPFSESWAFFIRKFDLPSAKLDSLITHKNKELAVELLKYLMAGNRVTGITGAQGSGKTTLLMAMIKYIPANLTVRVQEMAFELNIRKIYPHRNILSFQETDHVTGQSGLDLQKKTDGSVNILGEIATDAVATWMIQMAQVASLFTVFTHHAKTQRELVLSLRNSLLKSKMFTNEQIAEEQVINVVNFDIHLKRDYDGTRYIERVTECIPLLLEEDYPTNWKDLSTKDEKQEAFMETMTEYFRRKTDRRTFTGRNIIEFVDGEYRAIHPISSKQQQQMLDVLSPEMATKFKEFLQTHWGEVS